jgi:hypothetical protein
VRGDPADAAFCAAAAQGAAVVYHCMNPPYSTRLWRELLPRYMDNLIEAASRSGARLVVLDNVYMLGLHAGCRSDSCSTRNTPTAYGQVWHALTSHEPITGEGYVGELKNQASLLVLPRRQP